MATLFIRNVPFTFTDDELAEVCGKFGTVKSSFILRDPTKDHASRGMAYVTYEEMSAMTAAESDLKELGGRKVFVRKARAKEGLKERKLKRSAEEKVEEEQAGSDDESSPEKRRKVKKAGIHHGYIDTENVVAHKTVLVAKKVPLSFSNYHAEELLRPLADKLRCYQLVKDGESQKLLLKLKRTYDVDSVIAAMAEREFPNGKSVKLKQLTKPIDCNGLPMNELKQHRLILRNLSFKMTADNLRQKLEPFGELTEVIVPSKEGRPRGFGFAQFLDKQAAEDVINKLNMTEIDGRKVAIDWAVPTGVYNASKETKAEAAKNEKAPAKTKKTTDEANSDEDDEATQGSDDDKEAEVADEPTPPQRAERPQKRRELLPSDVGQGRTIFLRNVDFQSTQAELEEVIAEKFGAFDYVRICHSNGRSRGSAFVQMKSKELADELLSTAQSEGGFMMGQRRLIAAVAVERGAAQDLRTIKQEPVEKEHDTRNLKLLAYGMVKRGTQRYDELSEADQVKRDALQAAKTEKLRNPAMFLSRTRLSVHNIPPTVEEGKLRALFQEHAGSNAHITECRIMRDLNRLNAKGVGKSRGYAFVNFKTHEHAVAALEALNNSEVPFGEAKKLIIEFSVENRNALELKQRRMERSQEAADEIKNKPDLSQRALALAEKSHASKPRFSKGGKKDKKKGVKGVKKTSSKDKLKNRRSRAH